MMFEFIVGFCAILITISLMEFLGARKRLIDQQLGEIISRKLRSRKDALSVEILNLREANSVMRNLLMDIAENEASANHVTERTPEEIGTRLLSGRIVRRRELVAEVDAVLRSTPRHTDAGL